MRQLTILSRRIITFLSLLFISTIGFAQQRADSISSHIDSFSLKPKPAWSIQPSPSPAFNWEVMKHHPWFGFQAKPQEALYSSEKVIHGKELLFYLLVFLLIIFAFLKRAFPKYFSDLFRLFFRTTLKQRQVREQLMQMPLPALMLNCFFVISGGLYLAFLLTHYGVNPVNNFWLLLLYSTIGLSIAYLVKFVGLKLSGWLFSMEQAATSYIFIIFIVNKMMGILLLPFLVLLAFTQGGLYSSSLTLSFCFLAGLLVYRFILTYGAIRNEVRVNPFHFFLYILAFEIAPLLLVYKGLLLFFARTA